MFGQNNIQEVQEYSDLHVYKAQYDIKNTIHGNVFANTKTLNIDSSNNEGIIAGNLYATANTVNIKSNVVYSDSEKDKFGNYKLESITNASKIYGNVFVVANKFVLEPKCEIDGDLYVCANEIELSQNSIIRGNVFIIGNTLNLNAEINAGDLYANVKNFNMKYYGFIYRDLHLVAQNAYLEGCVYRNSFITAKNITTNSTFINKQNFNVNKAKNLTFSGEVRENANINSKNINFKSKDDNNNSIICTISGNLNYSSRSKIEQLESNNVVLGEVSYSKYNSLSNIWKYSFSIITSLIYVAVIYLILNKFMAKYVNKLSIIKTSDIFKYLGIGILFIILLPILSILLFITQVGSLLGLLLITLYILLLLLAKPIFIIYIANLISSKIHNTGKKVNKISFIYTLIITIILLLINLIPYVGFIVLILEYLFGLTILIKSIKIKSNMD